MDIPSFYTDIDQGIADIREIARHFVGKYKVRNEPCLSIKNQYYVKFLKA